MAAIRVTQVILEILTASGASAGGAAAASMAASLIWIASGISGLRNIIIAKSTLVSAEWIISGGSPTFAYSFQFNQVTNYAGFVSTANTSSIARTFSIAGGPFGIRQVSATVSDANSTITSAINIFVAALVWPNLHDGKIQIASQRATRVWPI